MPRLIVLLLTIAALAIVALQNLATEVPLVILGTTFASAIPLGILLVVTVGLGALLTLVFYALVGSRRPPESKYRPMGRRVPYPESPSSYPLPPSEPTADSSYGSSSGYSGSSAFVSEPETSSQPFVTQPQDRPVQDTPPEPSPNASPSDPSSFSQDEFAAPPNTYFRPNDVAYEPSSYESRSTESSAYKAPSETRANESAVSSSASAAASNFVQQPIAGLKSVFGKKKDRKAEPDESEKPIGDDWGQRRTKAQINSWDTSVGEPSRLEEGAKNLFKFGRDVGANAGRLAEDIASGWNNPLADGGRDASTGGSGDDRYADARYDGIDRGWENFDDYDGDGYGDGYSNEAPSREGFEKRTYGDSLYGNDDDLDSRAYPDEGYSDDLAPDGVYDADYKVIVPPSKPLTDSDDGTDDYA